MENVIEAKLNIILHKNQQVIHDSPARFKVIKAGKRFGKSKWAIFEICQWAGRSPGKVYWYVAPTYGQARDIAWNQLVSILPNSFIRRKLETQLTVELINGARIILKGAENQDSLRGIEVHGLILDEAAYINEYAWQVILRGQLTDDGFAYFISSPNEKGRNWFTNFCEDAKNRMLAGDKNWAYWYFTIYDNPTKSKEEIKDIERGMPEYRWNLEYLAIESDFAGQLYGEFDNGKHVGEIDNGEAKYSYVRGIDWGIGHPTVCLWAKFDSTKDLSVNNPVYVYDEHVKSGEIIADSCNVILSKTGNVDIEWTVIDPSTKKRNSQTFLTDANEFSRCGVPTIPGDNRERGIDIVKMFFKRNLIKIHPKCQNLLNELRNLQWGDKEGDDCTDALRYLLVKVHDNVHGMNIFENNYVPASEKFEHKVEFNIYEFRARKAERERANEFDELSFVMDEAV